MKVYLDNNATTKLHPAVLETMTPFFVGTYGNCSSSHCMGKTSKAALEYARQMVARNLNVLPRTIYFTSGSTEANNIVIKAKSSDGTALFSVVEHASVTNPIKEISRHWGEISVDKTGQVTVDTLNKAIFQHPNVQLVCIMLANNEVGTIMDIPALVRTVRARCPGAHFHCDATQYAGRWCLDAKALGVDSLCMSAHKFHGPRGVGVLYSKAPLTGCTQGGGQEGGVRPGTENLPGIVGLAAAMEMNTANQEKNRAEWIREEQLRDTLAAAILHYFPKARINSIAPNRLPNTLSVSIPGVDSRPVLNDFLCPNGIVVNAGSACSQGRRSKVLEALGVPLSYERGTFRFTLSPYTTKQEIDYTIQVLAKMARVYEK